MARIKKSPEVRRNELMDIAETIFTQKGCDHTSPSDIIREARIAQGTFYYYFRSKDDLVRAIIDRYLDHLGEYVVRVADDPALNAPRKLLLISDALIDLSRKKMGLGKGASVDKSISGREEYVKDLKKKILHLVRQIVRQGIAEGHFETEYPDETAEMLFFVSLYLNRELKNTRDPEDTPEKN